MERSGRCIHRTGHPRTPGTRATTSPCHRPRPQWAISTTCSSTRTPTRGHTCGSWMSWEDRAVAEKREKGGGKRAAATTPSRGRGAALGGRCVMDVLTSIWAAALHVPLVIRHFLALLAPALAVI